jgi:hypothetical protein
VLERTLGERHPLVALELDRTAVAILASSAFAGILLALIVR